MPDIAIRVENLGKRYRIGECEPYKALRDTLTDALCAPFRALAFAVNGRRPVVGGQPSAVHTANVVFGTLITVLLTVSRFSP